MFAKDMPVTGRAGNSSPFTKRTVDPFGCVLDNLAEVKRRVSVSSYGVNQIHTLPLCFGICFDLFANVAIEF